MANADASARSDLLPSYLGRLTEAPLLTKEEERTLTRAVRKGCRESRTRLIEANMRLVINIARAFRSNAIPLEDLIQEGAIGLMQAVERFDPDRGFRFSTYATYWIRQAIGRAIDGKSKTIRLPAHISQMVRKMERLRRQMADQEGREPTDGEIAGELDIPVKRVAAIRQSAVDIASLDRRIGDRENSTLGAMIPDSDSASPEDACMDAETTEMLEELVNRLADPERRVLLRRVMEQEVGRQATKELCQELSVSRKGLRTLEAHAVRKLRRLAQRHRMLDALSD